MLNTQKKKAMNLVSDELSNLIEKLMKNDDEEDNNILKEKIDVLEKMKEQIYKGNERITKKILKAGGISNYE